MNASVGFVGAFAWLWLFQLVLFQPLLGANLKRPRPRPLGCAAAAIPVPSQELGRPGPPGPLTIPDGPRLVPLLVPPDGRVSWW